MTGAAGTGGGLPQVPDPCQVGISFEFVFWLIKDLSIWTLKKKFNLGKLGGENPGAAIGLELGAEFTIGLGEMLLSTAPNLQ